MKHSSRWMVLCLTSFIHAQDAMVMGGSPSQYAPANQATLDHVVQDLMSPGALRDPQRLLSVSAQMRGFSLIPSGAAPSAIAGQPGPGSPVPVLPPQVPFQYSRYFTNVVVNFHDEVGLSPAEKSAVLSWMSHFPNSHLKGISRITFRPSDRAGRTPVFNGNELVVYLSNDREKESILSQLSYGVGFSYYKQGLSDADRSDFQSAYAEADAWVMPYLFATFYSKYLLSSQSLLASHTSNTNPAALQSALFVASQFSSKNSKTVSLFDASKRAPYQQDFVRATVTNALFITNIRSGLLSLPIPRYGRVLTIGNQHYMIDGNRIVGVLQSATVPSPRVEVLPFPWNPPVTISQATLDRFAVEKSIYPW